MFKLLFDEVLFGNCLLVVFIDIDLFLEKCFLKDGVWKMLEFLRLCLEFVWFMKVVLVGEVNVEEIFKMFFEGEVMGLFLILEDGILFILLFLFC